MSPLVRNVVPLLSGSLLATALAAQCPPGAAMPRDVALETTIPEQGPARVRWTAGQDAMKSGDLAAAKKHLLATLEFHPSAPGVLFDLALAHRDDRDAAAAWLERFVRASSDAQGRAKLDVAAKKQIAGAGLDQALERAQALAAARAAAITEVARWIDKNKPSGKSNAARAIAARWAAELLLELGLGAPQQLAPVAAAVAKTQEAFTPDFDVLLQAFARVLQKKVPPPAANGAPATGPERDAATVQDQRVRAARIVLGLQQQGRFHDLKGPPPREVGKLADDARRVLDEHDDATIAPARVWTIAELEALSPAAAEAFTREHRDWRLPGIAQSTTGRYRIETTCGYHTLLQVAKTIELHHERLVGHYGNDPFVQRQGLVRIVPEHSELETEGAPYWWASGFQAGDRTTVRFAWGRISALGRTLTHELTHRFDGVLRPFLPSWYGEGHADWTGEHYARMADKTFVATFLRIGTVAHTYYKGYADRTKFTELLAGKVADYRDNYFAGYSLYAFLRSYPPKAPRYAEALAKFEKNARAGQKDPVGFFTATFCDGKQGRPATFDELFADWEAFARGCYDAGDDRKPQPPWLADYSGRGTEESTAVVMDAPTWSWARLRAEPFFGQDHAAAATRLLHEVGDAEGTLAAGVWSLTVDGWRIETVKALQAALLASKATEAAQAFAQLARDHFPGVAAEPATVLAAALPRTQAFATALRDAGFRADHERIAARFGNAAGGAAAIAATARVPRHLGCHGFTESSLVEYEDRRTAGLWYATPEGDLHVGRERPRDGTGTLDRASHQRDAFVHTVEWLAPGAYTVRGRIHLTTAYVRGAIVLGCTRRDRYVEIGFRSGDFDYATGRTESNQRSGVVEFTMVGRSERDNDQVPLAKRSFSTEVAAETPSFEFVLHVRGPRVHVEIGGEPKATYGVHDGAPIEGHVGFATSMGAIRVQLPTVQRRDGTCTGLALDRQPDHGLDELLLLPTSGVPLAAHGTLVLWLPKPEEHGRPGMLQLVMPALAKLLNTPHEHPQQWVLAVPRELPAEARKQALATLAEVRKQDMPVVEHVVGEPFDGSVPWVLFVDSLGVLRAAGRADESELPGRITRWSRIHRQRER